MVPKNPVDVPHTQDTGSQARLIQYACIGRISSIALLWRVRHVHRIDGVPVCEIFPVLEPVRVKEHVDRGVTERGVACRVSLSHPPYAISKHPPSLHNLIVRHAGPIVFLQPASIARGHQHHKRPPGIKPDARERTYPIA